MLLTDTGLEAYMATRKALEGLTVSDVEAQRPQLAREHGQDWLEGFDAAVREAIWFQRGY